MTSVALVGASLATGALAQSHTLHLESITGGPQLFDLDLDTGTKTYLGDIAIGGTTAMAYDPVSEQAYFLRATGDLYTWKNGTSTTTVSLVGNFEDTGSGWDSPVPSAYSVQTGSVYDGSLYFVPTARPAGSFGDALYRIDFDTPTSMSDVVKVADMSVTGDPLDLVEWNNNDDVAFDTSAGILYGRSDTNDRDNSQRSSYFYSYDLDNGVGASEWEMITSVTYAYYYDDPANNPASWGDFRDANVGLEFGTNGVLYGTGATGIIGSIDTATGAWTPEGTYTPSGSTGRAGGDLAGSRLTPFSVPEPSSAVLVFAGMLLTLKRRR